MAVVFFLAGLAGRLAIRRPVWPWARSFPWASSQRVLTDALFTGLHSALLLIFVATIDLRAAISVLAVLPWLSLRAAGYIRRIPGRRSGAGAFFLEGFFVSGVLALLPWTAYLWLVCAPAAYLFAKKLELKQKVTSWLELHHASAGDPLSWSE